jgi:hypothetical protein
MGSVLFLPASAERSRAECRLPISAKSTPACPSDTAKRSHVIDVGSAIACAPDHFPNRFASASRPASVGPALNSSTTSPTPPASGRRTTVQWLATTAASMPIASAALPSRVAARGSSFLLGIRRLLCQELTDGPLV